MDAMTLSLVGLAFIVGATLALLWGRTKLGLVERQNADLSIRLASLTERVRSMEEERRQLQDAYESLKVQSSQWRDDLNEVRGDNARLTERALRVQELEVQLGRAGDEQRALQLENLRLAVSEADKSNSVQSLRQQLSHIEQSYVDLVRRFDEVSNALHESNRQRATLDSETARIPALEQKQRDVEQMLSDARTQAGNLRAELVQVQMQLTAERGQSGEKIALLQEARESLSSQFKNLATEILEEKSKRFTDQNQTNLGLLLDPLKAKLQEFQGKVEEVYVQEGKDRSALAEQVRHLMSLNQKLSEDAHNLTLALKGSSKTQGNWGELILERVLETSGLRKGIEYDVQESFSREDGSRAQPDVVIRLPEGKHLVVDAKVSLTAYEAHVNAESELAREVTLKAHVESVRSHIKGLSEKNYQMLYGLKSLDFVVMFVPVEPAFMLGVAHDPELWQDAWKRNVLLVSPSTLLFVVRTVAHLWRQEQQTRNAQEIAKRGAELYDKLVGFVEDLQTVGNRLAQAQKAYDGAYGKFVGGKGNVIRQAEMLKELGVKPTKVLPTEVVEFALEAQHGLPGIGTEGDVAGL